MKDKYWSAFELRKLSAQLHADQSMPADEVLKRDRQLLERLTLNDPKQLKTPHSLLKTWLHAISTNDSPIHQSQITAYVTVASFLMFVTVCLGVLSTKSLLYYAGTQPINVLYVVSILLIPQLIFLFGLLMRLLCFRSEHIQKQLGMLQVLCLKLITFVSQKIQKQLLKDNDYQTAKLFSDYKQPATSADKLLQKMRITDLYLLTQTAGSFFYIAALSTLLILVTLTDLSFGWSTTLQLSSSDIYQFVRLLTTPWLLFKELFHIDAQFGVMTLETVEQTQFFRLDARFATPGSFKLNPVISSIWWQFICIVLILYGLLPRLILAGLFLIKKWRLHYALNVQEPDLTSVLLRLRQSAIARDVAPISNTQWLSPAHRSYDVLVPAEPPYILFLWRDFPLASTDKEKAAKILQISPENVLSLHAVSPLTDQQALTHVFAALKMPPKKPLHIIMLVEYFESPNKAVLLFLSHIHQILSGTYDYNIYILVGELRGEVFTPHRETHQVWGRKLARDSRVVLI